MLPKSRFKRLFVAIFLLPRHLKLLFDFLVGFIFIGMFFLFELFNFGAHSIEVLSALSSLLAFNFRRCLLPCEVLLNLHALQDESFFVELMHQLAVAEPQLGSFQSNRRCAPFNRGTGSEARSLKRMPNRRKSAIVPANVFGIFV